MSTEIPSHEITEEETITAEQRRTSLAEVIRGGEWFPKVPVEVDMQITAASGGILWSDGLDRVWQDGGGNSWLVQCQSGAIFRLVQSDTGEVVPWNEPLPPLSSEATVDEAADAAGATALLQQIHNATGDALAIIAAEQPREVATLVPAACDGIPLTAWFYLDRGLLNEGLPIPSRVGVYKTKVNYMPDEHGDCDQVNGYCYWNGKTWGPWSTVPAFAEEMAGQVDNIEVLAWRGLSAEHPDNEV